VLACPSSELGINFWLGFDFRLAEAEAKAMEEVDPCRAWLVLNVRAETWTMPLCMSGRIIYGKFGQTKFEFFVPAGPAISIFALVTCLFRTFAYSPIFMFKRVEKRLKRKEREDELGLDEDMKDVLGLNDTDSDESDSDSSAQGSFLAIDNNGDEDEDLELGTASDDELERREDEADAERALVTVSEALNNPVFIVSLDPDISECIVCPGKLLKGTTMAEKHKTSNACALPLTLVNHSCLTISLAGRHMSGGSNSSRSSRHQRIPKIELKS
jgi:hypothetical protein